MNSMVDGGHVNSLVEMEVKIEICADVECTHADECCTDVLQ